MKLELACHTRGIVRADMNLTTIWIAATEGPFEITIYLSLADARQLAHRLGEMADTVERAECLVAMEAGEGP